MGAARPGPGGSADLDALSNPERSGWWMALGHRRPSISWSGCPDFACRAWCCHPVWVGMGWRWG